MSEPTIEHSPTPWTQAHEKCIDGMWRTQLRDANGEVLAHFTWPPVQLPNGVIGTAREANAEFVTRACNSHEALLAALKNAVEMIRIWHGLGMPGRSKEEAWQLYQASPEMQRINAALSLAEAGDR